MIIHCFKIISHKTIVALLNATVSRFGRLERGAVGGRHFAVPISAGSRNTNQAKFLRGALSMRYEHRPSYDRRIRLDFFFAAWRHRLDMRHFYVRVDYRYS